jgi:hypothetical protein
VVVFRVWMFLSAYLMAFLFICGFLMLRFIGTGPDQRALGRLFLWILPAILLWTAYMTWLIRMISRGAF